MIKKTVPLGSTGHLLLKVTLPRWGDIADIPSTQKETQKSSQNRETNKHVPNKKTEKISRKKTK